MKNDKESSITKSILSKIKRKIQKTDRLFKKSQTISKVDMDKYMTNNDDVDFEK